MAARSAKAGFTLIEMTVVVLLLGLTIMVIAVGGYFGIRDSEQLKDEARYLAGFLEQVRSKAALTGKRHVVEYGLDEDNQNYFAWVPREPEEGEIMEYDVVDDEAYVAAGFHDMPTRRQANGSRVYAVWIDRIAFADGSETSDREVKIDFMPTGGGHWHYVYLTNAEGDFYTIEVNPFTGSAEVYPGEIEPEEPIEVD